MGSNFRFACDTCSVDKTELTGCGMSGISQHICACDTCRAFKRVETNEWLADEEANAAAFICKKCSSQMREIAPRDDGYRYLGQCPKCKGRLMEERPEVFMLWD